MNRRGFFGALVAAPLAAVAGLRNKGPIGIWGRQTFKRHRPKVGSELIYHPDHQETITEIMSAQGNAAGESFSMSKGLVSIEGILGRKGT